MSTTSVATARPGVLRRLWHRELPHYPANGKRFFNLGLVVAVAISLYYEYLLTAALSTHILAQFHISFLFLINMAVLGNALGAVASLAAGLADKYGRANLIVIGLLMVGLIATFGNANAQTGAQFMACNIAIGIIEGVVLVATPALMRDFTPQVGRAAAMGFWATGPVVGILLVSLVVSHTSESTPWQHQYRVAGLVVLAMFVVALFGLRELAPALRDQLMVSARDRALIEARAKGIDVEASLRHPFRQILKLDIIGSALGIALFWTIQAALAAFLPIMMQTAFGYSQAKANSLGNWTWAALGVSLIVVGFVSDKMRVRKPFILVGAVLGVACTAALALHLTQAGTSYATFAVVLAGIAIGMGLAYGTWIAGFTETVEKHNPALTATGLSVWAMLTRFLAALTIFIGPYVVHSVTTVAQQGPTVKALASGTAPNLTAQQNAVVKAVAADPTIVVKVKAAAASYSPELATAAKIDPATTAALKANPTDQIAQVKAVADITGLPVSTVAKTLAAAGQVKAGHPTPAALAALAANGKQVQAGAGQLKALAAVPAEAKAVLATYGKGLQDKNVQASLRYLQAHGPVVKKAAAQVPHQWQNMFWIVAGGEILFIPFIFLMTGAWDPRKARRQAAEHEAWLQAELAKAAADRHEPALI